MAFKGAVPPQFCCWLMHGLGKSGFEPGSFLGDDDDDDEAFAKGHTQSGVIF